MPKGASSSTRARKPYVAQACTVCRAKKSKCDGVKPFCGSCVSSGRESECLWGRDVAARKPRTEAHFEALRKRANSLQAYCDLLETLLSKCVCQDVASNLPLRPEDLDVPDGGSSSSEFMDSDEEMAQDLTVPAQRLKMDNDYGGLLRHGLTSPFRLLNQRNQQLPPPEPLEYTTASYVLLVDGVNPDEASPEIDWSRHLPPEVPLDRKEHDRILDVSFKFFTNWCFRVVPSLFLKDMYAALSVPRCQQPPRTPQYSPMLHNALLALCGIFSDDPRIRDPKTRRHFADTAQGLLEAECRRPDVSLVHALAFLGTYHSNNSDRIMGELYFGMCSRISVSLGLGIDPKVWVKSGLLSHQDMVNRNWAYWTIFSVDVCWAIYFGRESYGPPASRPTIPLPYVDIEADQVPWHHPSANIPPQPNLLTLTFRESSALYVIANKIVDTVNGLQRLSNNPQDVLKIDDHVTRIDLELNTWKSRLPQQLDITQSNKMRSTPHKLMLHCQYWWCSIIMHQPFFNRRTTPLTRPGDSEVDHVKLCKRAAENIMDLVETWSSLYSLRYVPVPMLQVVFSAGTVFVLFALQATASLRIAHGTLKTSLAQVELCIRYLDEISQTWSAAGRTADILRATLDEKLKPVISRRLSPKSIEELTPPTTPELPEMEMHGTGHDLSTLAYASSYQHPLNGWTEPTQTQSQSPDPMGTEWLPELLLPNTNTNGYMGVGQTFHSFLGPFSGQITHPSSGEMNPASYMPPPAYDANSGAVWDDPYSGIGRSRHF
ncbi:hypothetical protein FB45DRAFT_918143 [Roridomyces roridus]|uniref:Zn(2)-C6 fungal-type domain-containing protein n=1 Tax=Roridomyces roridus TaxID=1738132 RepID=A0AAD7BQW0_9AGAR|nr:hypothetical protein FB45DRAFT_918143 [Roridomyces roridus]